MPKCFECGASAQFDWIACPKCGSTLEHTAPLRGLMRDGETAPSLGADEVGTWVQHGGLWLLVSMIAGLMDGLPDGELSFSKWIFGLGLFTFMIHSIQLFLQRSR